jgi:hypothetical protein
MPDPHVHDSDGTLGLAPRRRHEANPKADVTATQDQCHASLRSAERTRPAPTGRSLQSGRGGALSTQVRKRAELLSFWTIEINFGTASPRTHRSVLDRSSPTTPWKHPGQTGRTPATHFRQGRPPSTDRSNLRTNSRGANRSPEFTRTNSAQPLGFTSVQTHVRIRSSPAPSASTRQGLLSWQFIQCTSFRCGRNCTHVRASARSPMITFGVQTKRHGRGGGSRRSFGRA